MQASAPQPLEVISLCSGSRGNATYVHYADTRILIDCGCSCKVLKTALAVCKTCLEELNAVFITHEHEDHVRALAVLCRQYSIPVHIVEHCAHAYCIAKHTELPACFVTHPILFTQPIGDLVLSSFPTSHDSAASVGYRICANDTTISLATDMGMVTNDVLAGLRGAQYVILEANHDENLLLTGPYPYPLKRRILSDSGHLSNDAAAALCVQLLQSGTRRIMLSHLSEQNNTPLLARQTVLCALQDAGITDAAHRLEVACPKVPVALVGNEMINEEQIKQTHPTQQQDTNRAFARHPLVSASCHGRTDSSNVADVGQTGTVSTHQSHIA